MARASAPSFVISNLTKKRPPLSGLFCAKIKNAVLGESYRLSLVIAGKQRSRTLNKKYRSVDKPTDILSFPLSSDEGEIFINPDCALIKSREFGRSYKNYLHFILIHGLIHLKGFKHGSKMEHEEKKFRKLFNI